MSEEPTFAALARQSAPPLDELALALAAEFRSVDRPAARAYLDALGSEVAAEAPAPGIGPPQEELARCARILGERHGFRGESISYGHPDHSMFDIVLENRRGLPILLSVVYAEVGRRAGITLEGVGLPGHFVVGHFGADPPVLVDPFVGGRRLPPALARSPVRPWGAHEIAFRMLNNLVGTYTERADLARAMRAAELRLMLPLEGEVGKGLRRELLALRARWN